MIPVEGRKVILNDGTVIDDGAAGYADGFLWVWFSGYTIQQAASLFFDSAKTSTIVFLYGEMQDEYTGFTTCRSLMCDADGRISVCMTKGENN